MLAVRLSVSRQQQIQFRHVRLNLVRMTRVPLRHDAGKETVVIAAKFQSDTPEL